MIDGYPEERLRALLPWPGAEANKYTRGRLVLVAGSAAYPGAACLAAFAGQRMGAGYTEVVCAPESVSVVRAFRPGLVVRSWEGRQVPEALRAPTEKKPCACVIGPGFDARGNMEKALVNAVLTEVAPPVVVDGGALTLLAGEEGLALTKARAGVGQPLVLTPHEGEAARLEAAAGISPAKDPAERAAALALAYRATVVLKGPVTYISDGTRTFGMTEGTPALAKAGTGDVLAGMIGALLAQGLAPMDSAVLGATLHARAGRAAADTLTDICVTPEDVVDALPQVIARMRSRFIDTPNLSPRDYSRA